MSGSITLENRFGVNKMELISLKYAIFVIVLLVLYYCFPKKYRWYVLLAGSMAYYVIICKWYVLFIIFTICTTYGSTIWIDKLLKEQNAIVKSHKEDWDRQTRKEYKEKGRKKRVAVMLFALLCNFGILAFQLVTLPVEFNASRRGLKMLTEGGYISYGSEEQAAKKVLRAAAMTYVVAALSTFLTFLRLVMMASRNRRR